jgi:mannosyl-3-phosphoglycerate phosphatase
MTIAQVAQRTGLPIEQASRAKIREASEPFFIDREIGDEEVKRLKDAVAKAQLCLTRGGRFFHLIGQSDKRHTAHRLIELYRAEWPQTIRTIGLGDSPNDLQMLEAVDLPILVRKKTGEVDPMLRASLKAKCTACSRPLGWNEAILEILSNTF